MPVPVRGNCMITIVSDASVAGSAGARSSDPEEPGDRLAHRGLDAKSHEPLAVDAAVGDVVVAVVLAPNRRSDAGTAAGRELEVQPGGRIVAVHSEGGNMHQVQPHVL